MLLERCDIDVNLSDVNGETPLHFAVQSGARWAVMLIIADPRTLPNEQSSSDLFPLSIVALNGNLELLEIFIFCNKLHAHSVIDWNIRRIDQVYC